jgi:hypothetical protein
MVSFVGDRIMAAKKRIPPTFEVSFKAPELSPECIPPGVIGKALSAIQDLASGRDPFDDPHVPTERSIALVQVRRGSAIYSCVAHAPDEATTNLTRIGGLLSSTDEHQLEEDGLVAALSPIKSLSSIARSVGCRIEVALAGHKGEPLFVIVEDAFERISSRLLLHGDTTVVGRVERVGGATSLRCLMRVPGRRHILYCDVESKNLAQQLGQHLYEQIVASGTATWIHRSWRIYSFKITGFSQPRLGNPREAIKQMRNAGLKAWDQIPDPETFIQELRS